MKRIDLNGSWTLQFGPQLKRAALMEVPEIPATWRRVEARVPGNVELELIREGLLPERLDLGNNIYRLRDFEAHQWWFSRAFSVPGQSVGEPWELVLEGGDTLASVWLNGVKIGTLENMLIPHRLDVTGRLREGENHLFIGIDSTVLAAREQPVEAGCWAQENNWESLTIRKAPHGFGWDIMPRAVSAGLWRGAFLESPPATRFRDVYVATASVEPARRRAKLAVRWDIAAGWPLDAWSVRVTVEAEAGGRTVFDRLYPALCAHGSAECDLEDVDLWWPRGCGRAALHTVSLELVDGQGRVHAERKTRTGIRTARLERTECTDESGTGRFGFVVNGERIFIRGTNWVPLDALHSRDAARLDETFDLVVDLNCNMVRCWGGNVYESEAFFRRCDEAGVLVWQDFAFACALYPQTGEFHAKVRREAEAIIPLLRNHPSLALWAGNNEIDAFYPGAKPGVDPNVDDRISREVLASACRRLDPWRDYLPSSPYYGPELWSLGAPHGSRPEDHLWGPRDDFKGSFYLSSNAHFASEIGYHGCPVRSSLERMMTPANLWPWQDNEEWLTHAVRPLPRSTAHNYRIQLMASQIKLLFGGVPGDLDDFIFASQFSQAEALKFFIERFRISKGRRSGLLWWNVRDGWPQFSDAVVDYYGGRKLAYRVVRRVQSDVCVMLDEPREARQAVVAVNDTLRPVELETAVKSGASVLMGAKAVVPANGVKVLGHVPASPARTFHRIEWRCEGTVGHNHYLAGARPFELSECRSWYQLEGIADAPPGNNQGIS
jgi:beta-mannosidase